MLQGTIKVDRERLEAVMRERRLTNVALAERMDMHYNGVQRIKREESTSIDGLERLCNALECHPFDLLVAVGYPNPFCPVQASL